MKMIQPSLEVSFFYYFLNILQSMQELDSEWEVEKGRGSQHLARAVGHLTFQHDPQ